MRISHCLLLAFASLPNLVFGRNALPKHDHGQADYQGGESVGLVARYPNPAPQCNSWVGIEKIYMVEMKEYCPEGSTVTETITECVSTLTRSICATPTTNLPCYPCVFGTPSLTDDATVTVTSCATATENTVTITIQYCSTCTTSTYIGTVPGYTPGAPCHGCTPYGTGQSEPCTETESALPATTTTTSTTATVVDTSGCTEETGSSTTPPGNPKLPSTTTTAATHTPYRPTTAAPPVATAAGVRNSVFDGWVWIPAFLAMVGGGLGV